ncbi:MAG: hypothetical protein ACAI43_17590 [Phycisphaerae bacterium]
MTDDDASAVVPAYWRHVDGLDLPPNVLALARLNVHDALVLDVRHEPGAGRLDLRLRCGDLQAGHFDATLSFSCVTIASACAAILARAAGSAGTEILYDEVDRGDAGGFAYRLLLHPEGNTEIGFADVNINRRPADGRYCRVKSPG